MQFPVFVFLAAAFLFAPSLSYAQKSVPDTPSIGEALDAYKRGDLGTAIGKLQQIYRLRPNDQNVRLFLGLLLYEQNSGSKEARELMESVADRFPDNDELQIKLLDSCLASGEQGRALSRVVKLQGRMDRDNRLAFQVIYLLVRYGLPEPAGEQVDRVATRVSASLERMAAADRESEKGKAAVREMGEVFFIRGLVAASLDRKAEAMDLLQRADRCDFPLRDSFQMLMLADCLYRLQETDLASQAYEEYLKHHPGDDAARMKLGDARYGLGRFDEARAAYEEVRKKNPQYPMVNFSMGKVLLDLNQFDDSEHYIREALKSDPACGRCLAKLAHLEYLRGRDDECRELLDKAVKLEPGWTETYLVYGLLYNRAGQYDLAVRNLEKVILAAPDYPTAHFQIALAYQRSGNAEKAKEHREIYNRLIASQKQKTPR